MNPLRRRLLYISIGKTNQGGIAAYRDKQVGKMKMPEQIRKLQYEQSAFVDCVQMSHTLAEESISPLGQ